MIKRIKNTMGTINDNFIRDLKLYPLFENSTKLLFQLFVLEILNKSSNERQYQIIYGFCIKTTREEILNDVSCSKEFTTIYKTSNIIYSINKISIYNYPEVIINITNNLLEGISLKTSLTNFGIDASNLQFDLFYNNKKENSDIVIRPVIFNDTNTILSRNPFEKNALISPYQNVPSYTLQIVKLNKTEIFISNKNLYYDDWEQSLLESLKYLQTETNLPFKTSGCSRFGNIEFINTQCANEYEVYNISEDCIKEEVTVDYSKKTTCKKVQITIHPNIFTCSKNLLVNCYLENGGQIILDECKKVLHKENEVLKIDFESKEEISQVSVSIWKEENEVFQMWYRQSHVLIRQIVTNMAIVGAHGVVNSPWLDIIEQSCNKTKDKIEDARKISKASYSKMTIGNYGLDPWVTSDRTFSKLIDKLSPKKSDAEFFPKGWDSNDELHGALSFLEWFKKITNNAAKVVIQDPFYDTVGLEFLIRTTDAATDFVILTCTQIVSTDDKKIKPKNAKEPNRAIRIKKLIKSNPSLFDNLKLSIYDLRNIGGGDTNILHDRYILIFEEGELSKGFHLSNSIQGATKKSPLLITPIPADTLSKVDNHISKIITEAKEEKIYKISTLYNYKENKTKNIKKEIEKIADKRLFTRLKNDIPSEKSVSKEVIVKFIDDYQIKDFDSFTKFWSTFGNFLAHTHFDYNIISVLKENIESDFIDYLKKYLQESITAKYPIGFSDEISYRSNDFSFLFRDDFEEIVNRSLTIEGYIHEAPSYKAWGIYYGSQLLLDSDFNKFLELVNFLQQQYNKQENIDLSNSPLLKLTNIVFTHLYEKLFWSYNEELTRNCMQSNNQILKAIITSAIIPKIIDEKEILNFEDAKNLLITNLSTDEALSSFIICLLNHRFYNKNADSQLEKSVLSVICDLLNDNYTEGRLLYLFNKILYAHYPLIEKKITEEIFIKLEDNKKVTANLIFKLWTDEFIKLLDKFESYKDYAGIIDLTGWALYIIDDTEKLRFLEKLKKRYKKEVLEIRKPFSKSSLIWNNAFERLLLIKNVLMITILYEEKTKSIYSEGMQSIVTEISTLEKNYQLSMPHSSIYKLSRQILEKSQE